MSDYRILVTGSRHRTDEKIFDALSDAYAGIRRSHDRLVVVHGGASGADSAAVEWVAVDAGGDPYGVVAEPHPADWTRGPKAGPERNQKMVDLGADLCLAFPGAADSRGTWDCLRRAVAAGIETRIYPEPRA